MLKQQQQQQQQHEHKRIKLITFEDVIREGNPLNSLGNFVFDSLVVLP